MKNCQNSSGLCFTSPSKHPSRKMNPICCNAREGKNTKKSCSKNNLSQPRSNSKNSCSQEKLTFGVKKEKLHKKNVNSPEENQNFMESKHQVCSETLSFFSENDFFNRKPQLQSSLGERLNKSNQNEEMKLKDRKLSDNLHEVMGAYEQLKIQHELEEKAIGGDLNERELHRLRKIFVVEEAKCMLRGFGSKSKRIV